MSPTDLPPEQGIWLPAKPAIIRPADEIAALETNLGILLCAARRRSGAQGGSATISGHATLSTNLLSYWKLEEVSGTRADEVGGFTLTDNGTVGQGTGKQGNCGDFEQANAEFLNTASHQVTTIGSGSYSAFAWINPESITGNNGTFGAGILSSINSEAVGGFMLGMTDDGALYFYNFTRNRFKTDTTPCAVLST